MGEVIYRYRQAVPELPMVLAILEVAFFLIAVSEFAHEMRCRPRSSNEWRIAHGWRHSVHAYRNLGGDLQSTVTFAVEMMLWAAATIIAMQIYYGTNNAWLF